MLLKDKLDQMKQDAEAKKQAEALEKGKKEIVEIDNKKETLQNKIINLKSLLAALENAYAESKNGVAEFAESSEKINKLFEDYSTYLKESGVEQGLDSVSNILNDKEFSAYEEVKDYHGKAGNLRGVRAKKVAEGEEPEARDPKSIGKIEKLSAAKEKVKEAFPEDIKLNFRGKKEEGKAMSPRAESILKIKNYIKELEQKELSEIKNKESETKAEYLPKMKEMISRNLDKMLPDERATAAALSANFNFISSEILEFCGDELWPETKKIALELIREKYKSKGIGYSEEEASDSLEAEKLIYDVQDIRAKHEGLLVLDRDRDNFSNFKNEIKSEIFKPINTEVLFRDGQIFPNSLLKQAEDFKEKNLEVEEVCRKSKEELTAFLISAKEGLKPGVFAGKQTKVDMQTIKNRLEVCIERMNALEVPKDYYGNVYNFTNGLGNAELGNFSQFSDYSWYKPLKDSVNSKFTGEIKKIQEFGNNERNNISGLESDLRAFYHSGYKTKVGGFSIPYEAISEEYSYKNLNDKKAVDSFFERLSGVPLTEEEFRVKFEEELAVFDQKIKDYPDSEKIINRFNNLSKKYDEKFQFKGRIIDTKLKSKDNPTYRSPRELSEYNVKQELFYQKV